MKFRLIYNLKHNFHEGLIKNKYVLEYQINAYTKIIP